MAKLSVKPSGDVLQQAEAKASVKGDAALLTRLRDTTPDEAEQWVEDNVNSLADAKNLMKKLTKLLVYLAKKELS